MGIFSDHLRNNIERVFQEVNYKINHTFYLLSGYAVNKSPKLGQGPYVAGHFINNWFPAVNGFDGSTTGAADPDGAGSIARIEAIVKNNTFYKKDGFITLSNNVSYGSRVELLGWPKGYDAASGWNWTGKRMIYAPVAYAMQLIKEHI